MNSDMPVESPEVPMEEEKTGANATVAEIIENLQNNFDEAMLQSYREKAKIDEVRNQLSKKLYEADAAKRTIARQLLINRERQQKVQQLQEERRQLIEKIGNTELTQKLLQG
eukprot:TRINITY_DN143363_c0_g1_i1.p1 TRINITY_DN143363_c0_g1~~TRINITY_DN143363_c0_g1_i1.p1  ORF type:complete len:130 (+),score=39.73 TRINITY_DN143363_c0_g1_i1:57-392(+)